jgi:hypothetical protein
MKQAEARAALGHVAERRIAGVASNDLFARRPADVCLGTPDGVRAIPHE